MQSRGIAGIVTGAVVAAAALTYVGITVSSAQDAPTPTMTQTLEATVTPEAVVTTPAPEPTTVAPAVEPTTPAATVEPTKEAPVTEPTSNTDDSGRQTAPPSTNLQLDGPPPPPNEGGQPTAGTTSGS